MDLTGSALAWTVELSRELEVLEVHDVTPQMRRIVLGGTQLGAFTADGRDLTGGFDDHVKLFLRDPDDGVLAARAGLAVVAVTPAGMGLSLLELSASG